MEEKEYLDKEGLAYYHNKIKGSLLPEYQVKFEPTENQTLSATLNFETSFSGSSDFTVSPFSNPVVTPSVIANSGYSAGTPSVTRNGNIFTVSATDAIIKEIVEFDVAFNIYGYAIDYDNNNTILPIQFKQAEITKSPVFYFSETGTPSGLDDADIVISPDLSWIVSGTPSDSGGTYVLVDREELVRKDQFIFTKGQISDNNLVSLKLGQSGITMIMPVISSIQLKSRSNTSNVKLMPYLDVFLKTPSGDISIDSLPLGYPFTVSTNDSNSKKYTIKQNRFSSTIDLEEETVQKMKEGRSTLYFQVAFHTN